MCQDAPTRRPGKLACWVLAWMATAGTIQAQPPVPVPPNLRPDWRRIGGPSYELFLASPATGPVDRVWFPEDGERLFVRTASGRSFESDDLENWRLRPDLSPPGADGGLAAVASTLPEPGAAVRAADGFYARLYAFGSQVYRSDDGGDHWTNLTSFRGRSILGAAVNDLAVSPSDPDVLVAVNRYGVWRSADGGLSWIGLNDTLPNLPAQRLLNTPAGTRGARVLLSDGKAYEWAPGEKQSWQPVTDDPAVAEVTAREAASAQLGVPVTAIQLHGGYSYAGAMDGSLWVSSNQGGTWHLSRAGGGAPVEALSTLPDEPGTVFAAFGELPGGGGRARVLRSTDGGLTWEDLTGDLPPGPVHGLAAARGGGALYAATSAGIFFRPLDAALAVLPSHWTPMSENLPQAAVTDVRLDEAGNQLYIALEGYGVYSAPAPHRFLSVDVVNSADFSRRAAAPGSLLTVLGGRLVRAQAGLLEAPVLHATEAEAQIQVPFEIRGDSTQLALELARGRLTMDLPLQEVSPAIFVDRDGSPLLLDAASGVLLDALHPARGGARVQVLATGLGRVQPAWPTGMAAPLQQPPAVMARMRAYLNGAPIEVTRATLAPGYVGFYLVEVLLPSLVNAGPGELHLEAEGRVSNQVRIDLEP
jgi:uncharacterized protein (TIGR03437 family)